jgi:hypothetical protein
VAARIEKRAQSFRGDGNGVRRSNADDIEAGALAVANEEGFRLGGVLDQKSRSA